MDFWEVDIDCSKNLQSWCILVMCTMRMARKSLPMRSKRKRTWRSASLVGPRVDQLIGDKIQPTFYNGNAGMFIMLYKLGIKQPHPRELYRKKSGLLNGAPPERKPFSFRFFVPNFDTLPVNYQSANGNRHFVTSPSLTGKYNYLETFQPLRFVHFHQLETPKNPATFVA